MNSQTTLSIGFDDTDSRRGMCTTYLAFRMVDSLKKEKVEFLDFPRLVRFNPNIPWKTRGNGAVSLKIRTKYPKKIKKKVSYLVKKYSDIRGGANPGLVFFDKETIPKKFSDFSNQALWQLISRSRAKKFAKENNLESFFLGNGQGLVGAIGAIGYQFEDTTLELLSYRKKSRFGKKRIISKENVKLMQKHTHPFTFNSYDSKKEKILIAPHGPDPVFYGIRGEGIDSLFSASKFIKTKEKLDGYMIFKSNQGTSDHLKNELDVSALTPYLSGTITGLVLREPKMEIGGHVMFSIQKNGKEVRCAVYRPTGLNKEFMYLKKRDKIRVGGGIRKSSKKHEMVLNVEILQILKLEKITQKANPFCDFCKKRMKSKGRGQGFECKKCGKKSNKKSIQKLPRKLKRKTYFPIPSAHRHLTRPEHRIGITNKTKFDKKSKWFALFRN